MNSKYQQQNYDIFLSYHSENENYVSQIQRQLIIYGQLHWHVCKYNENIDFNANFYEKRLNYLMRSSVLICFITRGYCQFDTLKKELFIVEKTQKWKKVILIFLEKIPLYALSFERFDLMSKNVFILDSVSIQNDYLDENFQVLLNFLRKSSKSADRIPTIEGERKNQLELINNHFYVNRFIKENFQSKLLSQLPAMLARPLSSNIILPSKSTFNKQFELFQKKYENLLELYNSYYNFDRRLFINYAGSRDILVKFEQIENEIGILLKSPELNSSVTEGNLRLPNSNLLSLMNLLMKIYYFKKSIIKQKIDVNFVIVNNVEYKNDYLDVNAHLKQLFLKKDMCLNQEINLLGELLGLVDDGLLLNINNKIADFELDLKKERLLNIYENLIDLDKSIQIKEIALENELNIKERFCPCFKNERIRSLENKIELFIKQKNELISKIEKNQEKLRLYYMLKQLCDFIERFKSELDALKYENEVTVKYLREIDTIEYTKYQIQFCVAKDAVPKAFKGHIFIQLFNTDDFKTPKILLNRTNSTKNKIPFLKEEIDEFEIFTWKFDQIQFIKLFLDSEHESEEIFIKFVTISTSESIKLNFKVDRALSKLYGDCKTEVEVWQDKLPDRPKNISFQISIYTEFENEIDKKVEFLIQLHGDKGITTEIPFENVKGQKVDQFKKQNVVLFEKTFIDYFIGDVHTLVLYSKNFQYLYVKFISIKLPQKIFRFDFEKWIGKRTGNGNIKYIKFGIDEETKQTVKISKLPQISEFDEEQEEDAEQ